MGSCGIETVVQSAERMGAKEDLIDGDGRPA